MCENYKDSKELYNGLPFFSLTFAIMHNLLNIFMAILVIGWLIGFLALDVGGLIHMLLVVAMIVLLLKIIAGKG